MKFKKVEEPVVTSDFLYDLFDGGYINPADMLEKPRDVKRVEEAIATINVFLTEASAAGAIELS